jgi:pimeloyl-ACP methyl ester carboxylesterase
MNSKTQDSPASRESSSRVASSALIALAASATAAAGLAGVNAVRARRATKANPPLGKFVTVRDVELHYLARGTGPTIVLLHGNGLMIEDWIASGLFETLAKSHRVIAFDRPGFGHSERPRTTLWTPVAQAQLIADALKAIGEDQVTVVGHSFGAMVALALGQERPELVSSLVLIGGYYYPSARVDVVLAAPPAVPLVGDVIRYTASPLIGAAAKPAMEEKIFAPAPVSAGWRSEFPFEMTLRPSQIRAAAADAALMIPAAATLAERLLKLRVPLTIIAGASDEIVDSEAQSARLADEVQGSDLRLIPGAGHMVHHTASGEVSKAIAERAGGKPGS